MGFAGYVAVDVFVFRSCLTITLLSDTYVRCAIFSSVYPMVASRDTCPACGKPFYGKKKKVCVLCYKRPSLSLCVYIRVTPIRLQFQLRISLSTHVTHVLIRCYPVIAGILLRCCSRNLSLMKCSELPST
jgi:hypothetical protein